MLEELIKETARQRAERIWHNYRIQRQSTYTTPQINYTEYEKALLSDRRMNDISSKLVREIREIVTAKYNQKSVTHYLISIRSKRYRLLKEKLRRLEAENGKP